MTLSLDVDTLNIQKYHGQIKITCDLKAEDVETIKLSDDMNLCSIDEDKEIEKDIKSSMYT